MCIIDPSRVEDNSHEPPVKKVWIYFHSFHSLPSLSHTLTIHISLCVFKLCFVEVVFSWLYTNGRPIYISTLFSLHTGCTERMRREEDRWNRIQIHKEAEASESRDECKGKKFGQACVIRRGERREEENRIYQRRSIRHVAATFLKFQWEEALRGKSILFSCSLYFAREESREKRQRTLHNRDTVKSNFRYPRSLSAWKSKKSAVNLGGSSEDSEKKRSREGEMRKFDGLCAHTHTHK